LHQPQDTRLAGRRRSGLGYYTKEHGRVAETTAKGGIAREKDRLAIVGERERVTCPCGKNTGAGSSDCAGDQSIRALGTRKIV